MRFAVYLPDCMHVAAITQPWEHGLTGQDIALVAKTAERLGYAMVFLPEHFLTPTSHLELSGNHYFDATTAQAFLAGATSTITSAGSTARSTTIYGVTSTPIPRSCATGPHRSSSPCRRA